MTRKTTSRLRLESLLAVSFVALFFSLTAQAAPLQDATEVQQISDGCYYNYNSYNEGDRILTNEPCLNCTCHNSMLMCYLRVCPFTKPIGHDCIVEKREDQCCPIVTCPEVPVDVPQHTHEPGTELSFPEKFGCSIENKFYLEGAQVPSNPNKPCELCYCIKNRTSCLIQECTLHIDGCTPIYNKGSCCPVRYNCDHENNVLELEDHSTPPTSTSSSTTTTITTTERPSEGFILTTTMIPAVSTDCIHDAELYADGASITSDNACEHCYCMRGKIVCAVQECEMPMLSGNGHCQAIPPAEGECCPSKYKCDDENRTTLAPEETTVAIEEQETTTISSIKDLHGAIPEEDLVLQTHIDDIEENKKAEHDLSTDLPIGNVDKSTDAEEGSGVDEKLTTSSPKASEIESSTVPPISLEKEDDESYEGSGFTVTTKATDIPVMEKDKEMETATVASEKEKLDESTTYLPELDMRIDLSAPSVGSDLQTPIQKEGEQFTTAKPEIAEKDIEKSTQLPIDINVVDEQEESGTTLQDLLSSTTPKTYEDVDKESDVKDENVDKEIDVKDEDVTTQTSGADKIPEETNKTASVDIENTANLATTVSNELEKDTDSTTPSIDNKPALQAEKKPELLDTDTVTTSTSTPLAAFTTSKADEDNEQQRESTTTAKQPEDASEDKLDVQISTEKSQVPDEGTLDIQFPPLIPGEGDCLVNQKTYINNSVVPTTNECEISCKCISSVVLCKNIHCEIPQDLSNCVLDDANSTKCCPVYKCAGDQQIAEGETDRPHPLDTTISVDEPLSSTKKPLGHVKDENTEDEHYDTTERNVEKTTLSSSVDVTENTEPSQLAETVKDAVSSTTPHFVEKPFLTEKEDFPEVEDVKGHEVSSTFLPLLDSSEQSIPTSENEIIKIGGATTLKPVQEELTDKETGTSHTPPVENEQDFDSLTTAAIPSHHKPTVEDEFEMGSGEEKEEIEHSSTEVIPKEDIKPNDINKEESDKLTTTSSIESIETSTEDLVAATTSSSIDLDVRIPEDGTDIKSQEPLKPEILDIHTILPEKPENEQISSTTDKTTPSTSIAHKEENENNIESTTISDETRKELDITTISPIVDATQLPTEKDLSGSTDKPKLPESPQENVGTKEPSEEESLATPSPVIIDKIIDKLSETSTADYEPMVSSTIRISEEKQQSTVQFTTESTSDKNVEDKNVHLTTTISPTVIDLSEKDKTDEIAHTTAKSTKDEDIDSTHTVIPFAEKPAKQNEDKNDVHTIAPVIEKKPFESDNKHMDGSYDSTTLPTEDIYTSSSTIKEETAGKEDNVTEIHLTTATPVDEIPKTENEKMDVSTDDDKNKQLPTHGISNRVDQNSSYGTEIPLIIEKEQKKPAEQGLSHTLDETSGKEGEKIESTTASQVLPTEKEPSKEDNTLTPTDSPHKFDDNAEVMPVIPSSINAVADDQKQVKSTTVKPLIKETGTTQIPDDNIQKPYEIPSLEITSNESVESEEEEVQKIHDIVEEDSVTTIKYPSSAEEIEDKLDVTENILSSEDKNVVHPSPVTYTDTEKLITEAPEKLATSEIDSGTITPISEVSSADENTDKDNEILDKLTEAPIEALDTQGTTPKSDQSENETDENHHKDTEKDNSIIEHLTQTPIVELEVTTPHPSLSEKLTEAPVEDSEINTPYSDLSAPTEGPVEDITKTHKEQSTSDSYKDIDKDSDVAEKTTEVYEGDSGASTPHPNLTAPVSSDQIHKDNDVADKITESPIEDSDNEYHEDNDLVEKTTPASVGDSELSTLYPDLTAPDSDEKIHKDSDVAMKMTETPEEDSENITSAPDLDQKIHEDSDVADNTTKAFVEDSGVSTPYPDLAAPDSDEKIHKDSDVAIQMTEAPVEESESMTSAPKSDEKNMESDVAEKTSETSVEDSGVSTPYPDLTVTDSDEKIHKHSDVAIQLTETSVQESELNTSAPNSNEKNNLDSDVAEKTTETSLEDSGVSTPYPDLTAPDSDEKIHKDSAIQVTEAPVKESESMTSAPKSDEKNNMDSDVVEKTTETSLEDSGVSTLYPDLTAPDSDEKIHMDSDDAIQMTAAPVEESESMTSAPKSDEKNNMDSDVAEKTTETSLEDSGVSTPYPDLAAPDSDEKIHKDSDVAIQMTEASVEESESMTSAPKSDEKNMESDVAEKTSETSVEDSGVSTPYPDLTVTDSDEKIHKDSDVAMKMTETPEEDSENITSAPDLDQKIHEDSDVADNTTKAFVENSGVSTLYPDLAAPDSDEIHKYSDKVEKVTEASVEDNDVSEKVTEVPVIGVTSEVESEETTPKFDLDEKIHKDAVKDGLDETTLSELELTTAKPDQEEKIHQDKIITTTLDVEVTTPQSYLSDGDSDKKTNKDSEKEDKINEDSVEITTQVVDILTSTSKLDLNTPKHEETIHKESEKDNQEMAQDHITTTAVLEITTSKSDLIVPELDEKIYEYTEEEMRPLSTEIEGTTPKLDEKPEIITEEPFIRTTLSPLGTAEESKPVVSDLHETPALVNETIDNGDEVIITTTTHPLFPQHVITTISPGIVDRINLDNKADTGIVVTQPNRTESNIPKVEMQATTAASYPQPPPPVYGQPPQYPSYPEDEYGDEEEAEVFGPGTCRYGGKLYVSAQQIPRDDPCDFCFCFRSDIICLQQSCPPPIAGCHEEPISGFCCPRYECPVSMATVLNITTSTTTTSTTLPPHFQHHSYGGAVQKNGCQINGRSYRVGDRIDSTSGPCMNCTCGGDGKMKCDPQTCLPDPTMQQVMAVVAASKQR